jgi:hypothetical protein
MLGVIHVTSEGSFIQSFLYCIYTKPPQPFVIGITPPSDVFRRHFKAGHFPNGRSVSQRQSASGINKLCWVVLNAAIVPLLSWCHIPQGSWIN